jgi:hypothetical protein
VTITRAVTWEGFYNARDLGGLPTRSGCATRPGAFIRSADLRFVTDGGWGAAHAAGVRTIVDLRNPDEIRPMVGAGPTRLSGTAQFVVSAAGPTAPPGIDRVEVPLDGIEDVEDPGPIVAALLAGRGTATREVLFDFLETFDAERVLIAAGASPAELEIVRGRLVGDRATPSG